MATKEIREIVKWVVHVYESGTQQNAELVGIDASGNEYRIENRVYVHGTYHDVEPSVVLTVAEAAEVTKLIPS